MPPRARWISLLTEQVKIPINVLLCKLVLLPRGNISTSSKASYEYFFYLILNSRLAAPLPTPHYRTRSVN